MRAWLDVNVKLRLSYRTFACGLTLTHALVIFAYVCVRKFDADGETERERDSPCFTFYLSQSCAATSQYDSPGHRTTFTTLIHDNCNQCCCCYDAIRDLTLHSNALSSVARVDERSGSRTHGCVYMMVIQCSTVRIGDVQKKNYFKIALGSARRPL